MVRPALEAAMAVARAGERERPAVAAPTALQRYLSFARLPDPALDIARRALDDEPDFRERVAATVTEASVGRAAWLFLVRPEGWKAELDRIRKMAAAEEMETRESRAEATAQRRLVGAEAALVRSQQITQAAEQAAQLARGELDAANRAGQALHDEVVLLRADVARLGSERSELIRRLKDAEAVGQARTSEIRTLRHELRMAQAELTQAVDPAALDVPAVPAEPGVDRAQLAGALARALVAVDELGRQLGAAVTLVEPDDTASVPEPTDGPRARHRRQPRRPAPLPGGVLDDGPEAADHLVRLAGALVLVDGYNVAHEAWHDLGPADQRDRLLGACAELHARCGAEVEVVFDGVGAEATARTLPRSDVRYWFTREGVEADDELLARADSEPAARVVVVVSSDRRVVDGARRLGANVLPSRAFLAALRR